MSALPEAKALPDPPTDGITALEFFPNASPLLASTSWDGCVRVHDTQQSALQVNLNMESGPLLSLTIPSSSSSSSSSLSSSSSSSDNDTNSFITNHSRLVTGGLDGSVRLLDIPTNTISIIGRHSGEPAKVACSCLRSIDENIIASAGWNSQLQLWDIRSSSPIASMDLPGKAFGMDVDQSRKRIVVATSSGRRLVFCDFQQGKLELALDRESSLKYQTRCVQFFPSGHGIALGSIEGRVAVEYLPENLLSDNLTNTTEKTKYAFKCHRIQDTVYPVNAIAFCPSQQCTFATGGCDGVVAIWDGLHKKKLTTLPRFSTSIAALSFSSSGSHLAIAASYTFEEGERDHPRDEIFVRPILPSEVQPKGT